MPGSYHNVRKKILLSFLFILIYSFGTLSFASSYATTKAIEYYENGDYKRAKAVLSGIDILNDPTATYMMGAIILADDEFGQTSSNLYEAIYWFEISAKLNFSQAYQALGSTYEQRWLNNRQYSDFEKSQESYSYAVNMGVSSASNDLERLNARHVSYYKEKPKEVPTTIIATVQNGSNSEEKSQIEQITEAKTRSDDLKNPKKRLLSNSFMFGLGTVDVSGIGTMATANGALKYYFMDNLYVDIDLLSFFKKINGVDLSTTISNFGIGYSHAVSSQLLINAGVFISSITVEACNSLVCAKLEDDGSSFSISANYDINKSTELYARIIKSSYENLPDFDRNEIGMFYNFSIKNSMYLVTGSSDGENYRLIGYKRNF
jgi:hypothetical protein